MRLFYLLVFSTTLLAESILDLQLELDKANYALKETLSNRFLLVNSLVRVVEERCLKTTYPKPSNTKECLSAIEELKLLEPDLPTITCATIGIDSDQCSIIYAGVEVRPFNNEIEGVKDKFLSPEGLGSLMRSFNNESDPKKLLDTACRYSAFLKIDPPKESSLDVLANPFEAKGSKVIRFLSTDCLSAIKLAESYKLVPCYRFGFYSPYCLNVMKIEKQGSLKTKESGLASF